LLNEYYNELKRVLNISQGKIWDSLSEEQKKELLISFEESEDDNNLLDNETVMGKYKKWLKK
jgi:TRAP-type C4-dicarboxylate transport system substrate-binding protein